MLNSNLVKILKKYQFGAKKEINIVTNNTNNKNDVKNANNVIDEIKRTYGNVVAKTEIDDFDNSHVIILYKTMNNITLQDINFINEYVDKNKIIICIVPVHFDFNFLVKNIIANSINALSWKENNKKADYYIITIIKD